jgi:hypothetical protein
MMLGSRARLVVPGERLAQALPAPRTGLPLQPAGPTPGSNAARLPRRQARRSMSTSAAGGSSGGGGSAVTVKQDAWQALSGCQVYLASTGEKLDVTSLWSEQERVVLAFGRSMVSLQRAPRWLSGSGSHAARTAPPPFPARQATGSSGSRCYRMLRLQVARLITLRGVLFCHSLLPRRADPSAGSWRASCVATCCRLSANEASSSSSSP